MQLIIFFEHSADTIRNPVKCSEEHVISKSKCLEGFETMKILKYSIQHTLLSILDILEWRHQHSITFFFDQLLQ